MCVTSFTFTAACSLDISLNKLDDYPALERFLWRRRPLTLFCLLLVFIKRKKRKWTLQLLCVLLENFLQLKHPKKKIQLTH